MKILIYIGILIGLVSCAKNQEDRTLINSDHYNTYLETQKTPSLDEALINKEFWTKRLDKDTTGVGELAPLGGAYEALFTQTGNPSYLYNAEKLYLKGIEISATEKDAFTLALAHNYITQHRFKNAYRLLKNIYATDINKEPVEMMLFDTAMELGYYKEAESYLGKFKNLGNYNYLIRAAKWNDYRGDLDTTISLMEKARDLAEASGKKTLRVWTYSNLGDYYGHAGSIQDSYNHYLKTLELEPDNAYVKNGIAWIAYSNEGNIQEAHRILDSIIKQQPKPDYLLFKAELYEWEEDFSMANTYKTNFIEEVSSENYGDMYNAYLIELYAEIDASISLKMAKEEVENRATPETYHLLALAQLKNGLNGEALKTIVTHVVDKTFEPMALYHSALVFKANGLLEEVKPIKEELMEASFELGPVLMREIDTL